MGKATDVVRAADKHFRGQRSGEPSLRSTNELAEQASRLSTEVGEFFQSLRTGVLNRRSRGADFAGQDRRGRRDSDSAANVPRRLVIIFAGPESGPSSDM
jgi:methyl-accepting chemotaxis protein